MTTRYGALDLPLLGDLLHRAKDVGCSDPIRELVSRNSPAKPPGQVPGGWGEKAIPGEERLGDQVICECGHGATPTGRQ
jgi:hypothetical protein